MLGDRCPIPRPAFTWVLESELWPEPAHMDQMIVEAAGDTACPDPAQFPGKRFGALAYLAVTPL